jgi:hypothetical protein
LSPRDFDELWRRFSPADGAPVAAIAAVLSEGLRRPFKI